MSPTQPSPGASRWTEVDAAAFDAAHQAHLADRAHDPDPALWRQYDNLLALERLEPLPEADQIHLDRVQADYLADMRASQPEATS